MPVISLKNIHYTYPDDKDETLRGVSLEIEQGEFVAVLGHNGSGKSTLARHLNGILVPDAGTVEVCGMNTADEESTIEIRRRVGMVFQNPDNQIVANVVEDDVAFAPENLGIPPEEIRARVDDALRQVGMTEFREHAPHLLSGGQKQRVAIAGIIAMEPDIIVLDEPTAMLDPRGRKDVLTQVTRLCREKGLTVVYITHHMEECIHADRLIVMSDGRIVTSGTPREVFSRVELMESEGLTVPETVKLMHDLNRNGFPYQISGSPSDGISVPLSDGNSNGGRKSSFKGGSRDFSKGGSNGVFKCGTTVISNVFSLPEDILDVEECAEILCGMLRKGARHG